MATPWKESVVTQMTQRASIALARVSYYDDLPFTLVLFRYLWPFWLFRDASSGDRFARAAAYRHNRDMRVYLPGYLMKWMLSSSVALALTIALESFSTHSAGAVDYFKLMAAGSGMLFACGVCVLAITAYIYLYLSRNDG
jgi:hypothetical protein